MTYAVHILVTVGYDCNAQTEAIHIFLFADFFSHPGVRFGKATCMHTAQAALAAGVSQSKLTLKRFKGDTQGYPLANVSVRITSYGGVVKPPLMWSYTKRIITWYTYDCFSCYQFSCVSG